MLRGLTPLTRADMRASARGVEKIKVRSASWGWGEAPKEGTSFWEGDKFLEPVALAPPNSQPRTPVGGSR